MKYAPILIPTLCRYEHFKKCIESLKNNKLAKDSDLYIALDYPLNDSHRDGYENILHYIETINGFKSVNLIKRAVNFGAVLNIKMARKLVFENHDRIIVSEDDNVFSPNFLQFINHALNFYKNDKRIFSISGYCPSIKIPKNYKSDVFISQRFNAWGYGTWLDRWEKLDSTIDGFHSFIKSKENRKKFNTIGNDVLINLLTWKKKYYPADYRICYQLIKSDMYCVSPVVSKTNNNGFDGSGIHCRKGTEFNNPELDSGEGVDSMVLDIQPNKSILKAISKHHSSLRSSVKIILHKIGVLKFI